MEAWERPSYLVLRGGIFALPIADEARRSVDKTFHAQWGEIGQGVAQLLLSRARISAPPGRPLTTSEESEVQRLAYEGWKRIHPEVQKKLKRLAKLVSLETDPSERLDLARELCQALANALLTHAPLLEWLRVLTQLQPEPRPQQAPQPGQAAGRPQDIGPNTLIAGKFLIKSLLGSGGFGRVYRAEHRELGVDVALKVLLPRVANDEEAEKRFLKEVRSATSFVHRYAVQIREFGRDPQYGCMYFTMDLVEGPTLLQALQSGPLDVFRAVRLTDQILQALQEAHAVGLVHRDLKPQNLIISQGHRGEEIRILDFGFAKAGLNNQGPTTTITAVGMTVGTLKYMSPEQAEGLKLDGRSDLYTVGVILFQCLTLGLPIEANPDAENSRQSFLTNLLVRPPKPLDEVMPNAPPALVKVLNRALSKAPDHRYPSADELRFALGQAVNAPKPSDSFPVTLPTPVLSAKLIHDATHHGGQPPPSEQYESIQTFESQGGQAPLVNYNTPVPPPGQDSSMMAGGGSSHARAAEMMGEGASPPPQPSANQSAAGQSPSSVVRAAAAGGGGGNPADEQRDCPTCGSTYDGTVSVCPLDGTPLQMPDGSLAPDPVAQEPLPPAVAADTGGMSLPPRDEPDEPEPDMPPAVMDEPEEEEAAPQGLSSTPLPTARPSRQTGRRKSQRRQRADDKAPAGCVSTVKWPAIIATGLVAIPVVATIISKGDMSAGMEEAQVFIIAWPALFIVILGIKSIFGAINSRRSRRPRQSWE